MHTNSTPNYNLPQFVGSDIINPLTDFNDAFSTVDTTMKNIADAESTDASAITALQTAVGDAGSGLVKAVDDLETQNGDAALTTTAQTLSGAVNELDNEISTNTGNISTLVQKVGSDTLNTTAQTCTGAINELDASIGSYQYLGTGDVAVASDGVKTIQTLLAECANLFLSTANALNANEFISPVQAYVGTQNAIVQSALLIEFDSTSTNVNIQTISTSITDTIATTFFTVFNSTTSACHQRALTSETSGNNIIVNDSDVPASGTWTFRISYKKFKKLV